MIIRIIEEEDDVLTYIIFYYATRPKPYNVVELVQSEVFHKKRKKIMLFWSYLEKIVGKNKELMDQKEWKALDRKREGIFLTVKNHQNQNKEA
ncbi:hypothetical protein LCGC14_2748250 [marine sediment metagenome]|uniref:Uncharacterized protein n=1 Tax=marine sediment metagenome TaxID=412755 RepID=A0A0F9BU79_9ZZZZ